MCCDLFQARGGAAASPVTRARTIDAVELLEVLHLKGLGEFEDTVASAVLTECPDGNIPVDQIGQLVKQGGVSAAKSLVFARFIATGEYQEAAEAKRRLEEAALQSPAGGGRIVVS